MRPRVLFLVLEIGPSGLGWRFSQGYGLRRRRSWMQPQSPSSTSATKSLFILTDSQAAVTNASGPVWDLIPALWTYFHLYAPLRIHSLYSTEKDLMG